MSKIERKMGPMGPSDGRFIIRKCKTKQTDTYRLIFDWARPETPMELTFGYQDVQVAYDAIHAYARKSGLPVCQYACKANNCLLYTSPSPRDRQKSRMPSSA